jgi:two-component system, NarL family, nitrate/nitrite response regulator NarL
VSRSSRQSSAVGTLARVLIVADIRLYREGLAAMLDREPGLAVVATATDGHAALRAAREVSPDVVLVDLGMADSTAVVRRLSDGVPRTAVVALTVPETERAVIDCAEAGVAGYVTRAGSLTDVVAAVTSAARGEALCSPRMARMLLRRLRTLDREPTSNGSEAFLTARELEIVELIDEGLSNKEIAQRLVIEVPTVKNHVHHILEKLQVHRRSQAAAQVRARRARLGL